ncbi:MAG: hypothetical protein ACRC9R_10905, partial [Enterovibrio sp.]
TPANLTSEQPQQITIKNSAIKDEAPRQQNLQNQQPIGNIILEPAPVFEQTAPATMQEIDFKTSAEIILPNSAALGEHHRLQFDEKFKDFFQ